MATVGTHDKLIERTEAVIRRFFDREKKRAEEHFKAQLPYSGDAIYETLVGKEHVKWVSEAPQGMLVMVSTFRIGSIDDNIVGMDMPLNKPVASPNKRLAFANGTIESAYKGVSAQLYADCPVWETLVAPAEALAKRRSAAFSNQQRLQRFASKILREHKSLGPCLRMWPPLWDLLDDADRTRQGAKPYGERLPIPRYIGDEEEVKWATAQVVRIKMGSI